MITVIAMILQLIACCPRHEINRDPVLRAEVAGYFEAAGEKYDVPATLLVYWAYRESSLDRTAVGMIPNKYGVVLGEVGFMQVHGKAINMCLREGHSAYEMDGNIFCGAYLMDYGRNLCGSLERGLVWYASGSCVGTEKTRKKIKQRLRAWRKKCHER